MASGAACIKRQLVDLYGDQARAVLVWYGQDVDGGGPRGWWVKRWPAGARWPRVRFLGGRLDLALDTLHLLDAEFWQDQSAS